MLCHGALSTAGAAATAAARISPPAMEMRKAGWFPGGVAPSYLDGSLPGDVGFDPYNVVALARTGTVGAASSPWAKQDRKFQMQMMSKYEAKRKVAWMREAEIKHGRLAMLAAAGWPMSELIDGPLSSLLGMPNALASGGRAPSLFNGHLFDNWPFLVVFLLGTSYLEANTLDNVEGLTPSDYVAGDLGFDPLNLRDKGADNALAEIKHGRVAMLAVTGYAVQEFIYGTPVVQQSPGFFKPFFL